MINTVTLNPALDHILYVDRLQRNIANRLRHTALTMGGKGTHVSMNLAVMGRTSRAYGFGFGGNGRKIVRMLEESGVQPRFVCDMECGENRDNYLLVETDTQDATLLSDKGVAPAKSHVDQLYAMMKKEIGVGESVALSGDASNFTDPFAYNRIIELLGDRKPRIFLDTSGETLKRAIEHELFVIKPNLDELSQLLDKKIETEAEIVSAFSEIDRRCHIQNIVLSLGGDGSLARMGDTLYRVHPPRVSVYNTVGCGDCLLAGLLYGFEEDEADAEQILRYAAACSAATAESPISVGFDVRRSQELLCQVRIKKL